MGISQEEWRGFTKEVRDFIGEQKEHRGEVVARLNNLDDHVGSVSKKADGIRADLSIHSESSEAHGMGGSRRASGGTAVWIAIAISFLTLAYEVLRHPTDEPPAQHRTHEVFP